MIKTILIKNFRCINSLQIRPTRINLIVGRNNTGKTSILEAIESYYKIIPKPGNKIILLTPPFRYDEVRYMLKFKEKEATIDINNRPLSLFIDDILFEKEIGDFIRNFVKKYTEKGINNRRIEQRIQLYKNNYIFGEKNDLRSLFITVDVINRILFYVLFHSSDYKLYRLVRTNILLHLPREGGEEIVFSNKNLSDILSAFKLEGSRMDVKLKLDVEKIINKYNIENIERFSGKHVVFKDGKIIPLELLGDGFLQMIGAIYYLGKCKEIALLDEPTAFMHPGYIRKFVEYLIDVVKDKNLQVFISTHNIDLLETFLDFGEDDSFLKDNLKIIRLTRVNGDIRARELSFKEALEESEELYTDLRGI
jgi:AAA15 family ATPase/GTPase